MIFQRFLEIICSTYIVLFLIVGIGDQKIDIPQKLLICLCICRNRNRIQKVFSFTDTFRILLLVIKDLQFQFICVNPQNIFLLQFSDNTLCTGVVLLAHTQLCLCYLVIIGFISLYLLEKQAANDTKSTCKQRSQRTCLKNTFHTVHLLITMIKFMDISYRIQKFSAILISFIRVWQRHFFQNNGQSLIL